MAAISGLDQRRGDYGLPSVAARRLAAAWSMGNPRRSRIGATHGVINVGAKRAADDLSDAPSPWRDSEGLMKESSCSRRSIPLGKRFPIEHAELLEWRADLPGPAAPVTDPGRREWRHGSVTPAKSAVFDESA